jgi:nucleoside-diphosphate-sugar epimerase
MSAPPIMAPPGPVLITGASGFLGRHTVAFGHALRADVHTYGRRVADAFAVHHRGDLEDGPGLRETIARLAPRGIIHLAAAGVSYGQNDPAALLRTNALPLVDLLEAAAALPTPPSIVCAGSGFEYAPLPRARRESDPALPHSAYGASKAAATALASAYAGRVPITVVRPFSVYGVGEPAGRFAAYIIAQTKARLPVELTAGAQLRDYSDAADLAEGFWRVLAQPPPAGALRVLNVATGRAVTLRAFAEALGEALARAGCAADFRFGARPYRADEMMDYTADVSLLESTLCWLPATPLSTGLDRMVAAHLRLP